MAKLSDVVVDRSDLLLNVCASLRLDRLGGYQVQTPKGRSEKLQRVDPAWRRRSKVTMSESFAKLCSRRPGDALVKLSTKREPLSPYTLWPVLWNAVYITWPCPACDTALCSSFWWTLKWLLIECFHNTWKYQCRASRSELKVLVCEHDCCNRSMHDTVLGSLDGYIIVFLLSLKRVLWSMRELAKRLALSFPSSPAAILHILRCHVRGRAEYKRELAGGLSSRLPLAY